MSRNRQFEDFISQHPEQVQEWAQSARSLVLGIRPDAREELETSWGGYLLFKQAMDGGNTVCFVSAHKKHVSIGFSEGVELPDPAGLLQGSGKLQRHIKIKKDADLERPELITLLTQAWQRQPDLKTLRNALERIRKFCLNLPKTSESLSHGHPTFKRGKKSFAVYGIYSPSVAFKADLSLHEQLQNDDRFFPTPYLANKGWLSIKLDAHTDWTELESLLKHSYENV